jgi:NitT/TauT family transport system substrate-binding protein
MMKKKLLVSLIFAYTYIGSGAAYAADVVRVGNLKFAHYGAVWYMKEICNKKYNIDIQQKVFAKGIDIIPAIIAGEIDVAASAVDGSIAARASNVAVYIVAGFAKGGARIVGRSDLKWKSVADLKGKKIGVPRGGAQELILLAELDKHKLSFSEKPGKDVQLIYMAYADLNQALLAKNIDAISQSEPQSSQAIRQGFGVEIIKPYDTPIGEPIRTLIMTEDMHNNKKDIAQRFMNCFVESTKYFIDNPKEAEKYVRSEMFKNQLSAEEYHDAMDNARFTYNVTPQEVQISTDMMAKYGVAKMVKPPVATDFVKLELLNKAKKDLNVK